MNEERQDFEQELFDAREDCSRKDEDIQALVSELGQMEEKNATLTSEVDELQQKSHAQVMYFIQQNAM